MAGDTQVMLALVVVVLVVVGVWLFWAGIVWL
jgi:hypothetical protein